MIRPILALAVLLSPSLAPAWAADAGATNDQSASKEAPRNPEFIPKADQVWAGMPDYVIKDRASGDKVYFSDANGNPTDDPSKAMGVCNDTKRICYAADLSAIVDKAYKSNESAQAGATAHEAAGTSGGTVCKGGVPVQGFGPCPADEGESKDKKCADKGCAPLSPDAAKDEDKSPECQQCVKGEDADIDFDEPDAGQKIADKIKNSPDEEDAQQDGTGGFGVMGNSPNKSGRMGSDGGQGRWSTNPSGDSGTSANPQGQRVDIRSTPDILRQYADSIVNMFRGSKNADAATTVSDDQRTYKAAERISRREGTKALSQLDSTAERSARSAAAPVIGEEGSEVLDDHIAAEAGRDFQNNGSYSPVRVRWVQPKAGTTEGDDTDKGTHSNTLGSAAVIRDR